MDSSTVVIGRFLFFRHVQIKSFQGTMQKEPENFRQAHVHRPGSRVGEAEEAGGTSNGIGEDEIAAVGEDGAGHGEPDRAGKVGGGI
jgi:hypothetical protein